MEGYISTIAAAKILDCDPGYVRKLLRAKKVAGEKVGRDWVAEETSVRAYAAAEHKPGPKPASEKPDTSAKRKK